MHAERWRSATRTARPPVYRILVKRLRTDTDSCRAHRSDAEPLVR